MAAGQRIDLSRSSDPAVVTGLLKHLLKEAVLPLSISQGKELAALLFDRTLDDALVIELRGFISGLRYENRATLHAMIRLLAKVAEEPTNMMSYSNLGIALGPTLFPTVPMTRCAAVIELLSCNQGAIWPHAPHAQSQETSSPDSPKTVVETATTTPDLRRF